MPPRYPLSSGSLARIGGVFAPMTVKGTSSNLAIRRAYA
jgi:hypothetical protein